MNLNLDIYTIVAATFGAILGFVLGWFGHRWRVRRAWRKELRGHIRVEEVKG